MMIYGYLSQECLCDCTLMCIANSRFYVKKPGRTSERQMNTLVTSMAGVELVVLEGLLLLFTVAVAMSIHCCSVPKLH